MIPIELMRKALGAREFAYAPYSDFLVGAALLCDDGSVFTGCNVENASFGASLCAERAAAAKAVSFGYTKFAALAVVGGKRRQGIVEPCYPCGICRQFLCEFCDEKMPVYIGVSENDYEECTFKDLMPIVFSW